ncbi:hypothetical protein L218DRAFT_1079488 [Marasmius fiardii PR-910]|nr:hypothetical protein L218DRAFT_1079488 [Marasmius fiardii PR-910]
MDPQLANSRSPILRYLHQTYPLPHRYMLESNDPVYHPEVIHLKKTYEDAKKVKKQLEEHVANFKEHLIPCLETELTHVATVVREHALVLAPMRYLPVETLENILTLYLDPENQTDLLHLSTSAWTLAQVCQRWRGIVLAKPDLWSNIIIDLRDRERFLEPQYQGIPQILSACIRRSNARPLTIAFKSNSGVTSLSKRIMDILLQCRGRWHNVVLDVPPKLMPSDLFLSRLRGDGTPYLDSLAINISFLMLPGTRICLFRNSPHLKSVTLFGASALRHREGLFHLPLLPGVAVPLIGAGGLIIGLVGPQNQPTTANAIFIPMPRDITHKLPLPWKQLSTLDIEFGAWGDFLPVLTQTPNIVDCRLRSYVFTRNVSHAIMIPLPKLRSLRLSGTAVFCLHFLSARSLKSLAVEDATTLPQCGQHMIFPFIITSECTLQHLSFQSVPMGDHTMDVIKAAPSLSSLHLSLSTTAGSNRFETLLPALTYTSPGYDYPLPKLKTLALSVYHKDPFPYRKLVDMVRSRRRVPVDEENAGKYARLEVFRLSANISWVSALDELKEDEGLQTEFALR